MKEPIRMTENKSPPLTPIKNLETLIGRLVDEIHNTCYYQRRDAETIQTELHRESNQLLLKIANDMQLRADRDSRHLIKLVNEIMVLLERGESKSD